MRAESAAEKSRLQRASGVVSNTPPAASAAKEPNCTRLPISPVAPPRKPKTSPAAPSASTGKPRVSAARRTRRRSASPSSMKGASSRSKNRSKPSAGSAIAASAHQLVDINRLARRRLFHLIEGKGLHIGDPGNEGAGENLDRIVEPRHRGIVEAPRGGDIAFHFLEGRLCPRDRLGGTQFGIILCHGKKPQHPRLQRARCLQMGGNLRRIVLRIGRSHTGAERR